MWLLQFVFTALIGCVSFILTNEWQGSAELIFLFSGFLTIGLFHGSADLFLIRQLIRAVGEKNESGTLQSTPFWFGLYILVIVAVALLLFFAPQVLLLAFLVGSIFHFGESQFWRGRVLKQTLPWRDRILLFGSWGSWITLTPLFIHPDETAVILQKLGRFQFFEAFLPRFSSPSANGIWAAWVLFGAATVTLLWFGIKKRAFENKALLRELICLCSLQLLFLHSTLITSFGVYFLIWHSINSLNDQIQALENLARRRSDSSIADFPTKWGKEYIRAALPYWLLSVLGVIFLLGMSNLGIITLPMTTLIFGGAILLTPPHLIVLAALHAQLNRK